MDNRKKLFNLMKKDNEVHCYERLGCLFRTRNNTYFYDTGTGKVCLCGSEEEYIVSLILNSKIEDILLLDSNEYKEAIDNIVNFILQENAFYISDNIEFDDTINDLINDDNKLEQIVFELTENCNLRCKYCIYNDLTNEFRNFSFRNMTFETAKKGIDFALTHCGNDLVVGFYGGEPLLKFNLIKKIIQYIDEKNVYNKIIRYSITTNLLLMDNKVAEYFSKLENCMITCSIDGPKDIQNEFRSTFLNEPSFEQVLIGLQCLVKAFKERAKDCIAIYTVICPPYTKEKLNEIKNFFDNLSWLPKGINFSYTKVKKGSLEEISDYLYKDILFRNDPIKEWGVDEILQSNNTDNYVVKCESGNLMMIHNRFISNIPKGEIPLNGCCIPSQRRLYLTVDGTFLVCEKMGNSPSIGNCAELDFVKMKKFYIDQYKEKSLSDCSRCWVANICPICYSVCYNQDGIDIQKKKSLCDSARNTVYNNLVLYHEILESNPKILMELLREN